MQSSTRGVTDGALEGSQRSWPNGNLVDDVVDEDAAGNVKERATPASADLVMKGIVNRSIPSEIAVRISCGKLRFARESRGSDLRGSGIKVILELSYIAMPE